MNKEKLFLILDIDGVLLESQGYRLACIDTINHFLQKMGHPNLNIDRTITDIYEASGITAEWDMVPLTLAVFVNQCLEKESNQILPDTFPAPIGTPGSYDNDSFRKILSEKIALFSQMLNPDETPINAIYHALSESNGIGLDALWNSSLRDRFFIDTLDPRKAPFFAQLMNRLLGNCGYEEFYGLQAQVHCESYLETKDHLLISERYRRLLTDFDGEPVYPSVMTYRPTILPETDGNKGSRYFVNTPEGECALRLLGWSDGKMPMIGAGSLCYIEEKYDLRREYYVKPHPFHALAAILMGFRRDELLSLETARKLCELDPDTYISPLDGWFSKNEILHLAVFEDSVSGINSVKNAAGVLQKWGYKVKTDLCGIHSTEMKDDLLIKASAVLYKDINTALDAVLTVN